MIGPEMQSKAPEWLAFISYSHADIEWAAWLQQKLEFYRLPSYIATEYPDLPSSLRPIFRDLTDLQLGDLSLNIQEALDSSKFLIVICSKNAVKSHYVNDEISYFLHKHEETNVIPFIVDGIPHSQDSKEECFPIALRNIVIELLAANIKELGKDYAAVKVVSKLLGGLDILRLWDRYQEAEEQERIRLKKVNDRLLELTSRASALKAQDLLEDGDKAIAAKVALANIDQNVENSHPVSPEVESLLRQAMLDDAGRFYPLRHFLVSNYVLPKTVWSSNEQLFVFSDDLMVFIIDAISLRKISVGYGLLFEDTETVRFSSDNMRLLNCEYREFSVFDIPSKKVISSLSFCNEDDNEIAIKAFLFKNDSVVIVSPNLVRVYNLELSKWTLKKHFASILDSYIVDNTLLLVIKNKRNEDEVFVILMNIETGATKDLAIGNKWRVSASNGFITCILDDIFYVKSIDEEEFSALALDGNEYENLLVSEDGVSLLFDPHKERACLITNTHSVLYLDNVVKIELSVRDKWGVFINKENKLYCFRVDDHSIAPRIVSDYLFTFPEGLLDFSVSPCFQQILVVDNKKVCHLFNRTTLELIGERVLEDSVRHIWFTSVNQRFLIICDKSVNIVEWRPPTLHFDLHPKLKLKDETNLLNFPSWTTADMTQTGRQQIGDYPLDWGDPSELYKAGPIAAFSSFPNHMPVKAEVKGKTGYYFSGGKVCNQDDEVILSCEHFINDNVEKLESVYIEDKDVIMVGAKYSFVGQCVLYVWSFSTGRQVFTFSIKDPYFSLNYNGDKHYIIFGRHVIEYPTTSELIALAKKRYDGVELTKDDKTSYYLL